MLAIGRAVAIEIVRHLFCRCALSLSSRILLYWLRHDFRSRRQRELSGDDDGYTGANTVFDHHYVAILTLTRFDRSLIYRVVGLDYENEWTALA